MTMAGCLDPLDSDAVLPTVKSKKRNQMNQSPAGASMHDGTAAGGDTSGDDEGEPDEPNAMTRPRHMFGVVVEDSAAARARNVDGASVQSRRAKVMELPRTVITRQFQRGLTKY